MQLQFAIYLGSGTYSMFRDETISERAAVILLMSQLIKQSSETRRFNQNSVIPNLLAHLEHQGGEIPFFEKEELNRGLCAGLSAYYLYSRLNKRKDLFFSQLASGLEKNPDPLKIDKLNNYVRWFQAPHRLLPVAMQINFSENVNYIKSEEEPTIFPASGITFPFKEEEFVSAMQTLTTNSPLIILHILRHAMGLFVEGGKYYFFDPNFNCDEEIVFSNLHDLYAWLMLASVFYEFEELDKMPSPCLSISMNFYHPFELKTAELPDSKKLITEFICDEPNALLREATKNNPLFMACAANQPDVVAVMLEHNAKELLELREAKSNLTPLMVSCENGSSECTELLLKAGAEVDAVQENKSSALDKAIRSQNLKTVKNLVEYKADIYLKADPYTPLYAATEYGTLDIFQCLFARHKKLGKDANYLEDKKTLLYSALQNEKFDIALYLLENGADPNLVSKVEYDVESPLQIAIKKGNLLVIKALLAAGGNLGSCRESAISLSAKSKNVEIVKFFIAKKENEEKVSENDLREDINKAFAEALRANDFDIAEYLSKNYKISSRGDSWLYGNKLDHYPKIFPILKHELVAERIMHLACYNPFVGESLSVWAFKNSQEEKSGSSLKTECAQLIMNQLKKDPYQLFLLQATLRIKELLHSFSLELGTANEKIHKAYRFTRFYHENYYKKLQQKRNGLADLIILITYEDCSIDEALNKIVREYPAFLEGGLKDPLQDLIKWLKQEEKLYAKKMLRTSFSPGG